MFGFMLVGERVGAENRGGTPVESLLQTLHSSLSIVCHLQYC